MVSTILCPNPGKIKVKTWTVHNSNDSVSDHSMCDMHKIVQFNKADFQLQELMLKSKTWNNFL